MIRPIFFTTSCARDRANGTQAAVRATWLKTWGHLIDHRFVLGAGNDDPQGGELMVSYGDSYAEITGKNLLAYKWAAHQGYTHAFVGDMDTYVHVPDMLDSGFEQRDYTGRRCDEGHAGQGCGFFMSRKAFILCMDMDPKGHSWFDMMCGIQLRDKHGIKLHDDQRYYYSPSVVPTYGEWLNVTPVTVNLGRETNKFNPQLLYECHAAALEADQ